MQLIGAATPDVPDQTPMPQPSKRLLNACPIPPVHVIVRLLAGCQSAIISSNEWQNDMNTAFISTIMAPNFEIKEITSCTRRQGGGKLCDETENQNMRNYAKNMRKYAKNMQQNMRSFFLANS